MTLFTSTPLNYGENCTNWRTFPTTYSARENSAHAQYVSSAASVVLVNNQRNHFSDPDRLTHIDESILSALHFIISVFNHSAKFSPVHNVLLQFLYYSNDHLK